MGNIYFQFLLRNHFTHLNKPILSKSNYSAPSVYRPPFYRQPRLLPKFSSVPISPPLKIPCYTAKLSYRHPPQVFRHKSRKTNLNSPVSTAHNYLLTAVYWSIIMECQNWSSDTVIDLIVEGRNRWSVVLIRIITFIIPLSTKLWGGGGGILVSPCP